MNAADAERWKSEHRFLPFVFPLPQEKEQG